MVLKLGLNLSILTLFFFSYNMCCIFNYLFVTLFLIQSKLFSEEIKSTHQDIFQSLYVSEQRSREIYLITYHKPKAGYLDLNDLLPFLFHLPKTTTELLFQRFLM